MSRTGWAWTLPVLAVLSPAPVLQLYFGGNWYAFLDTYSLGMFFGVTAFVWYGLVLMLAGRIRVFDRVFGHDRVLVFHGYLAASAVLFSVVHAVLKYVYFGLGTVQVTIGLVALGLFLTVSSLTTLFMVLGIQHRLRLLARLRSFGVSHLGLDYSRLKFVHNFMSLAALCMVVHVMLASATMETNLRLGVIGGWGGLGIAVYVWHKLIRPLLNRRHGLTVEAVRALSDTVTELQLSSTPSRRPGSGQFVYLRLLSRTCGSEEHPFTLSSAGNADKSRITIKALGDYTTRVSGVETGTRAIVDGPYGKFTPRQREGTTLFLAGGIGITPCLSILREWDAEGVAYPTTLVWSVRRESDLIDDGYLNDLQERAETFRYVQVVTRPEGEGTAPGRIDRAMVAGVIEEPSATRAYLCGPDRFRRDIVRLLRECGVPRRAIHFERFST